MKATVTKKDGLHREMKIVVPAKELNNKVDAKVEELSKTMKVSGFRPGKVPPAVIKQRHGDAVMGEVLQDAVSECTGKAMEQEKLRPAMQPEINIEKFEKDSDLEYTVSFDILPEVKTMKLEDIKLEKRVTKADKKSVDEALSRIAAGNRSTKTVETKRATKKGDIVLIDFDGSVDGEKRDGMKGEGHELELGGGQFIPGFEDQLIGKKAGDDVTVTVTFPDPYMSQDLAGKEAVFEVKIHAIKEYDEATIDDAFAQKLGLKDEAELRERVKEQIEGEYENYSRSLLKRELLDLLEEKHSFDVPQTLVDAEFNAIWQQVQHEMKHAKEHGEDMGDVDEKALKEEYKGIAERRVRLGLVLSEIGTANKVEISREDLNAALISEARKYPGQEQQVFEYYQKNQQALESLKAPLYEDKVVDFIFDKADIKEKTVSLEELTKDPDADRSLTNPSGKETKKKAAPKKAAEKKTAAKK